jgi:hypothetical protein
MFGWVALLVNGSKKLHEDEDWVNCPWCGYEFDTDLSKQALDLLGKMKLQFPVVRIYDVAETCPRCRHWVEVSFTKSGELDSSEV